MDGTLITRIGRIFADLFSGIIGRVKVLIMDFVAFLQMGCQVDTQNYQYNIAVW